MSILLESVSYTWARSTVRKLKEHINASSLPKNHSSEQIVIKGLRYDRDVKRLKQRIKELESAGKKL